MLQYIISPKALYKIISYIFHCILSDTFLWEI